MVLLTRHCSGSHFLIGHLHVFTARSASYWRQYPCIAQHFSATVCTKRRRLTQQADLDNTAVHATSDGPALRTRRRKAAVYTDPNDCCTGVLWLLCCDVVRLLTTRSLPRFYFQHQYVHTSYAVYKLIIDWNLMLSFFMLYFFRLTNILLFLKPCICCCLVRE